MSLPGSKRPLCVLGFVGSTLDSAGVQYLPPGAPSGKGRRGRPPPGRWEKWRPTIDLCRHDDLVVDRLALLHQPDHQLLAEVLVDDIAAVSPETTVELHPLSLQNPWDFEEVYAALLDFAARYPFDDDVDYAVHITTGTHTAQICWFLLAESRRVPARLIQTSPPRRKDHRDHRRGAVGSYDLIDLDLSRYDQLQARFDVERRAATTALAGGIHTRNPAMRDLLTELELVATSSTAPLLLMGDTGVGKTRLARRIYELKKHRHLVEGPLVEVNCATLRGDAAMSTLFGHKKGSYTGATSDRVGLLRQAHRGLLFLDEIGELGLDEQAMLLKAIEDQTFTPMGADAAVHSDFQLVCGTHRDLRRRCAEGRFREDLLARLEVWSFALPSLRERPEDLAENLHVEVDRVSRALGRQVRFSSEATTAFLDFAGAAPWPGNFREFGACVLRLGTLAEGGRVGLADVERETTRLRTRWSVATTSTAEDPTSARRPAGSMVHTTASPSAIATLQAVVDVETLDDFDRVQLAHVLQVCRQSENLAEAGRALFAVSRLQKKSKNDTDRLRKYLRSHGIDADDVVGASSPT